MPQSYRQACTPERNLTEEKDGGLRETGAHRGPDLPSRAQQACHGPASSQLAGDHGFQGGKDGLSRSRHLGLKTWLSLEPEKEVQSPGQNQLGVMEDNVQGNRLPTCNLRGYIDTKKSMVGKHYNPGLG